MDVSGKRPQRIGIAASLFASSRAEVLPSVTLQIDGRECKAMVDSGCTRTLIHKDWCGHWERRNVGMWTVNEQKWSCLGVARVRIATACGRVAEVEAYVLPKQPFGFPCILGLDASDQWGGMTIRADRSVRFGECGCRGLGTADRACGTTVCDGAVKADRVREVVACNNTAVVAAVPDEKDVSSSAMGVDERDFSVKFDSKTKEWTVEWKWRRGQEPGLLRNKMEQYAVPSAVQDQYESEIREWIQQGWLMPYDEAKLGPPKGLIPMMAVIQEAKEKVRPVLDFRELNQYIEAHTREADVCAHKTREWRRRGVRVAMVDLKKAYLQLRVKQELWPYQTVKFEGRQYCLTRLGFGLNVAPLVMKAVLNKVLEQDKEVRAGTSAYVDDILVDEGLVSAERVATHLRAFGLETKQPERVDDGMRVLGMHVQRDGDVLMWSRDNAVTSEVTTKMTRREGFSLCGKLIGHYPVCGWLRAAVGYLKRRASSSTIRWDDVVADDEVVTCLTEVMTRLKTDDPVRGRWDVVGKSATVWVDASMLAYGAVLEVNGEVVEDASWLRKECTSHINMAELDAVLKGLNLALVWGMTTVDVMTDSATVHRWIEDGLTGKSRLKTKASNEMLIRRRVDVVMELVKEYGLKMTVTLIPSARNKADVMTRVPKKWLRKEDEMGVVAMNVEDVAEVHRTVGHPGVQRTLYFAKRKDRQATRRSAQQVVKDCAECQSIDPQSVKWRRGSLEVDRVWQRMAIDITHVGTRRFLTMIDCGPSRFAVWREIQSQTSEAVIDKLRQVFYDRGAPEEILTDNDTAFKSRRFMEFAADWAIHVRYRAAHVPSGNGTIERCHRTVKTIAARKGCSVMEAVYLHNVTPKDGKTPETAPMNSLRGYRARVRGVDQQVPRKDVVCRYGVGDAVWVRPADSRCDKQYDRGRVTSVTSEHTVEVNGVPRHVRDLRRRVASEDEDQRNEGQQLIPVVEERDNVRWWDWDDKT